MRVYKYQTGWYIASGVINKRFVFGAGSTFIKAIINALKS